MLLINRLGVLDCPRWCCVCLNCHCWLFPSMIVFWQLRLAYEDGGWHNFWVWLSAMWMVLTCLSGIDQCSLSGPSYRCLKWRSPAIVISQSSLSLDRSTWLWTDFHYKSERFQLIKTIKLLVSMQRQITVMNVLYVHVYVSVLTPSSNSLYVAI